MIRLRCNVLRSAFPYQIGFLPRLFHTFAKTKLIETEF
jgi:hypothetical protein